jgi:hypothetical protein
MSRPSIRETIAAARAKMADEQAKSKSVRGGQPDEREAFIGSGVPGVKKAPPPSRRPTEVEMLGHVQKSIKSLIANAKGTGKASLLVVPDMMQPIPNSRLPLPPEALFRHHQFV